MGGNSEANKRGAATKRAKYGADFFSKIGHAGGVKHTPGGFGTNKVGVDGLTGKERASKVSHEYQERKRLEKTDEKV